MTKALCLSSLDYQQLLNCLDSKAFYKTIAVILLATLLNLKDTTKMSGAAN